MLCPAQPLQGAQTLLSTAWCLPVPNPLPAACRHSLPTQQPEISRKPGCPQAGLRMSCEARRPGQARATWHSAGGGLRHRRALLRDGARRCALGCPSAIQSSTQQLYFQCKTCTGVLVCWSACRGCLSAGVTHTDALMPQRTSQLGTRLPCTGAADGEGARSSLTRLYLSPVLVQVPALQDSCEAASETHSAHRMTPAPLQQPDSLCNPASVHRLRGTCVPAYAHPHLSVRLPRLAALQPPPSRCWDRLPPAGHQRLQLLHPAARQLLGQLVSELQLNLASVSPAGLAPAPLLFSVAAPLAGQLAGHALVVLVRCDWPCAESTRATHTWQELHPAPGWSGRSAWPGPASGPGTRCPAQAQAE